VDAYGFERPTDFDCKSYDEFMARYVHVLARRAGRWAILLDSNDHLTVTQKCKFIWVRTPSIVSPASSNLNDDNNDMHVGLLLEWPQSLPHRKG